MTYPAFRNKWLGQKVDYDHVYLYQCVDLILQGLYEIHGLGTGVWGNAADYWDKPTSALLSKFDKVPDRTPRQGDILVFKRSAINGNAGHIAWADSATQMLEQNGGKGLGTGLAANGDHIRISKINFNNLLGILRPKGAAMETVNDGDNKNIYPLVFDRAPDDGAKGYIGMDWKKYTYTLLMSPEYQARIADFKNWKAAGMELTKERDTVLYPTIEAQKAKIANLEAQLAAKPTGGISAEDSAAIKETNSIVKSIFNKITSIFK